MAAMDEAPPRALFALDGHHALEPRFAADLLDAGGAAVEAEVVEGFDEWIRGQSHRRLPSESAGGRT